MKSNGQPLELTKDSDTDSIYPYPRAFQLSYAQRPNPMSTILYMVLELPYRKDLEDQPHQAQGAMPSAGYPG